MDVNDVDEAPTVSVAPTMVTVDETDTASATLATITAADPEMGALTLTCTFDPDDGKFAGSCDSAGGNGTPPLPKLLKLDKQEVQDLRWWRHHVAL